MKNSFLKNYKFLLLLITAILIGACLGLIFKKEAIMFKPFGDIFLNLLFMVVVPLVFFSISSAVAGMEDTKRLKNILIMMMSIFIFTGIISSVLMVIGVKIFPPTEGASFTIENIQTTENISVAERIVNTLTVSDFNLLLSRKNMLALIIFALLVGVACLATGEKGKTFKTFLVSGNAVMVKMVDYIMYYAPIGLGAYFAYLVGVFGPELFGTYARVMVLYYPLAILYFFVGFSFYAYIAGGFSAVKVFWSNIIPTALTALATGSSVATIPVNLEAAKKIGVPEDIREVVIPIGSTIHMDGTCLSAILKISVLFGIFQMDFSETSTILVAIGVALLSGTVMSGIPGGGFIGEMMIVSLYGFPPAALPIISMIGTLVDPPATMVNAVGDNVASMMTTHFLDNKKQWKA